MLKKEIIIIFSLFLAIAAIFAGLYLVSLKMQKEYNLLGVEIPAEVHAYNGTIKAVSGDKVLIWANADNNYLVRNQLLQIKFDDKTSFIKRVLPKGFSKEEESILSKEVKITFKKLKPGQQVEVYSKKNIKNYTSSQVADIIKLIEF